MHDLFCVRAYVWWGAHLRTVTQCTSGTRLEYVLTEASGLAFCFTRKSGSQHGGLNEHRRRFGRVGACFVVANLAVSVPSRA